MFKRKLIFCSVFLFLYQLEMLCSYSPSREQIQKMIMSGLMSEYYFFSELYSQKLNKKGIFASSGIVNKLLNDFKREFICRGLDKLEGVSDDWDQYVKKDEEGQESDLFKFIEARLKDREAIASLKEAASVEVFFKKSIQDTLQSYNLPFDEYIYNIILLSAKDAYGEHEIFVKMMNEYSVLTEILTKNPGVKISDLAHNDDLDPKTIYAQLLGRVGVSTQVKQVGKESDSEKFFNMFDSIAKDKSFSSIVWFQEFKNEKQGLQSVLRCQNFDRWLAENKGVRPEEDNHWCQSLTDFIERNDRSNNYDLELQGLVDFMAKESIAFFVKGKKVEADFIAIALEMLIKKQGGCFKANLIKEFEKYKQLTSATESGRTKRTCFNSVRAKQEKNGIKLNPDQFVASAFPCMHQVAMIHDHCRYMHDRLARFDTCGGKNGVSVAASMIKHMDQQNVFGDVLFLDNAEEFFIKIQPIIEPVLEALPRNINLDVQAIREAKRERVKLLEQEKINAAQEQERKVKEKLDLERFKNRQRSLAINLEKKKSLQQLKESFSNWLGYVNVVLRQKQIQEQAKKDSFLKELCAPNQSHAAIVEQARLARALLPEDQPVLQVACVEQKTKMIQEAGLPVIDFAKKAESREKRIERRLQAKEARSKLAKVVSFEEKNNKYATDLSASIAQSNEQSRIEYEKQLLQRRRTALLGASLQDKDNKYLSDLSLSIIKSNEKSSIEHEKQIQQQARDAAIEQQAREDALKLGWCHSPYGSARTVDSEEAYGSSSYLSEQLEESGSPIYWPVQHEHPAGDTSQFFGARWRNNPYNLTCSKMPLPQDYRQS